MKEKAAPMYSNLSADVVIIGGGIIGTSIAYALSTRGKKVVLVERAVIGSEASGRNAGGVRQQGRYLPEIPLAQGAVEAWMRLEKQLTRSLGYRQIGHVYVAENEAEMQFLQKQRERERPFGLETHLIEPEELRKLAPGINHSIIGAKFCPTDGVADPGSAPAVLADASEEAGAIILPHHPVVAIGRSNGKVTYVQAGDARIDTPVIINAAGPWAPYVSQLVNVYLPIYPSRLSIVQVAAIERIAHCFVQTTAYDFSGCQLPDGTMRLGQGANRDDTTRFTFEKKFDRDTMLHVSDRAKVVFPALENARATWGWTGVRECTPDMMPIMGPPIEGPEGFMICAGFSGHGFGLGPYIGQLMAEWIVDGEPSIDLGAFSFARFMRMDGPLTVSNMRIEQTG